MNADEYEKFRLAVASRVHETETGYGKAAGIAAVSTGMETVKAILLINGGACVAVLAFIGSLASQGQVVTNLAGPLVWFAAGAVVAVISAALGYLTNLSYAAASNTKTRHFEEPFVRESEASRAHRLKAVILGWITTILAVLGIVAFIVGVFDANCVFRNLRIEKPSVAPSVTTQNPK
jgi:hypothetical protein